MSIYFRGLAAFPLLFAQTAFAGITALPPQLTAVPIDSPWVISGVAITLAVIGARILYNRRK